MKFWNPHIMTHEHGTVKSRIVCDSKRLVETIMTDISVLDNVAAIKKQLHALYDELDAIHEDEEVVKIEHTFSETIYFR